MLDLEQNLIYRRRKIETRPAGGFVYVLHIPETNYIDYGLGWESTNGLQRKHVSHATVHELACYEESNSIAGSKSVSLKVSDALSQIFHGCSGIEHYDLGHALTGGDLAVRHPTDEAIQWLAKAIREVHDLAFGNPNVWEPEIISLGDGRLVWALYDDDADKVRLGIGFVDEANEPILGDNSFALSKDFIAEFVTKLWEGRVITFFSVPPRWSCDFERTVDNPTNLREIAKLALAMGDAVWPGEIVSPFEDDDDSET